jgi:hypothetical protein
VRIKGKNFTREKKEERTKENTGVRKSTKERAGVGNKDEREKIGGRTDFEEDHIKMEGGGLRRQTNNRDIGEYDSLEEKRTRTMRREEKRLLLEGKGGRGRYIIRWRRRRGGMRRRLKGGHC